MAVSEKSPASGTSEIDVYHPEHQPDYNATIDHGTSTYSPVPKRVMDGSEPGETLAAAVLSGAPVDLQARQVRCVLTTAKPKTNILTSSESTSRFALPLSQAPGVPTHGVWIGMFCRRVTDGRTR